MTSTDSDHIIDIIIQLIGWGYFIAWSCSFYPQAFLNWKRKSVVGLSFDFLALNLQGYIWYSSFNLILFFSTYIQHFYIARHHSTTIPVTIPDMVFAVHGLVLVLIQIAQCFIYERGNQRVSMVTILISLFLWMAVNIVGVLAFFNIMTPLVFIESFGYCKMVITFLKYMPQAYLNFARKSTEGWSIANIILDLTGSILSFGQMFVEAAYKDDWTIFTGDVPKLGLSLISFAFDILFVIQHYILYRPSKNVVNF
eukprot:TRINITY_DN8_c1_g2_i1.p1 TRINITY_DN8_c1_g2~~TRINITY_DN8_c1_g2_i1.p1  ORF type:complete len:254 (-),score=20.73 TRINITY_DN8_c1_g2_i1:716-1477(-)